MIERTITADWQTPTTVLIGHGRIRELIPLLKEAERELILIITDNTMINSPILKGLLKALDRTSIPFGCFCLKNISSDQTILNQASYIYKNGGFDCIVGIGRAGALDLAKLISLQSVLSNGSSLNIQDSSNVSNQTKQPLIYTIPVGSNNGAQVSSQAFLSQSNGPGKFIYDQRLRPTCVILDPNLLQTNSTLFLSATAMNTLSQALADWCSDDYNPAEKAIAEKTIRLVFDNLPNAIKKPTDINARIAIMSAAIMAHSKTIDKLGITSALSQAIQTIYGVESGLISGVLLPHILTAHYSQLKPKLEVLATTLNIKNGFNGFLATFLKMKQKAGIPSKLGLLFGKQKLKNKEKLLIESYASTYPQRLPGFITQKKTIKILNDAMQGKIQREAK